MKFRFPAKFCSLASACPPLVRADFDDDLQAAGTAIEAVMPKAGELLNQGRFDESVAVVVGALPEAKRTPAQDFVLANLLYPLDPKKSYTLHKQAAAGL